MRDIRTEKTDEKGVCDARGAAKTTGNRAAIHPATASSVKKEKA